MTYGGCGCAGGEVATVQDEHGRQRRLTKDTFGRLLKVEEINWNATVYATTTYTYNVRDQLTQSNQAGQLRSFGFDGYGRVQTHTTPEQGTRTYSYNSDDTTNVTTDARGATSTFGYNPRHLVTGITYGVPGGVAATPNVSFGYDTAGNRTSMIDGLGSVTYSYDQLSRMTAETRTLSGMSFVLNYQYNLGGELTSISNQWGAQVGYSYDKVGRPTAVTGSGYYGVTSYASNFTYRAFGSTKAMSYGDGKSLTTAYDNRLRPTTWNVAGVLGYNYNYDYYNEHTGRVTYAGNIYDATLDRSFEYDHLGRLADSHSGAEARAATGQGPWNIMDGPYSQGYDYDVWGNVTHKFGWGGEVQGGGAGQSSDIYYVYVNNRRDIFSFDAAGNLTNDLGQTFTYDAMGQQATASYGGYSLTQSYDGNGLRVKKSENGTVTYYLRSTVLGGQVVAEMNSTGGWTRGYVYAGSQLLAVQQAGVYWMHEDPVTKSKRVTNSAGAIVSTIELDPWGADTNRSNNAAFQPKKFTSYDRDGNASDEAMFRRYNRWHSRFDQPDPHDGSYAYTNPQSFNRYAYVHDDPVNLTDPSGLLESWNFCSAMYSSCAGTGGGGYSGTPFDSGSYFMGGYNDLPGNIAGALRAFDQRVQTTRDGLAAEAARRNGNYELVVEILRRNPNVGISVNGVELWGDLAAEFMIGYGRPVELAALQFPWPIDPEAIMIKNGFRAVIKLLARVRGPDFQMFTIAAVAGIGRFVARGDDLSTALHSLNAGEGAEISYTVGWILMRATPTHDYIVQWGSGLDFSANIFWIIGGGVIKSAQPGMPEGVIGGVGAGIGVGASFTYKPW